MISRFFKTLWDWLFVPHGYLSFKQYSGTAKQVHEIMLMNRVTGGKARPYNCKVCHMIFWSMKPNPTCRKIKCFFSYRMKNTGHPVKHHRYNVVTKAKGTEKNHTIKARSFAGVLKADIPGKIIQIQKEK